MPPPMDVFGWCTWDAFYHKARHPAPPLPHSRAACSPPRPAPVPAHTHTPQVSAAGIEDGLQSLAACGTPARTLIIDDGWQTISADSRYAGASITGAFSALAAMASWVNQTGVREPLARARMSILRPRAGPRTRSSRPPALLLPAQPASSAHTPSPPPFRPRTSSSASSSGPSSAPPSSAPSPSASSSATPTRAPPPRSAPSPSSPSSLASAAWGSSSRASTGKGCTPSSTGPRGGRGWRGWRQTRSSATASAPQRAA